jgi:hypothetical protein
MIITSTEPPAPPALSAPSVMVRRIVEPSCVVVCVIV